MRQARIRTNHVKDTLADGGVVLGTWLMMSRSASAARLVAAAGFDFVFIDTEHSDFSWETVGTLCDVARACDVVPVVRPYDAGPHLANRIQDLGAMGLMYHDVTSRSQVDEILEALHYPPRGHRGTTALGATMDYVLADGTNGADVRQTLDANTMLVAQIESPAGVANLPAILEGGGVDLVEVGRGDLSAAMGLPMQPRHPSVMKALDGVIATCTAAGVAVGVNCGSLEDGTDLIDRGVRSLAFSNDRRILLNAYLEAVEELSDHASAHGLTRCASGDGGADDVAEPALSLKGG
jgi:2-keto-3-deoxy-L-rhamnonate aldolase RhmA